MSARDPFHRVCSAQHDPFKFLSFQQDDSRNPGNTSSGTYSALQDTDHEQTPRHLPVGCTWRLEGCGAWSGLFLVVLDKENRMKSCHRVAQRILTGETP